MTSKRRNSKRKEMKDRLVKEIGAEEFRKIVQNDYRKREGASTTDRENSARTQYSTSTQTVVPLMRPFH